MMELNVTIVLPLPFPQMSAGWLCRSSSSKFWGGLAEVKRKFMDPEVFATKTAPEHLQWENSEGQYQQQHMQWTKLFSEIQVAQGKAFPSNTEPVKNTCFDNTYL